MPPVAPPTSTPPPSGSGNGGTPTGGVSGNSAVSPSATGYRGDSSQLQIVDATHLLKDCASQTDNCSTTCTYNSSDGIVCNASTMTLDHVYIKGGFTWNGNSMLTITNSVIEGGGSGGNPHTIISSSSGSPTVSIYNSTLRWPSGRAFPTNSDNGNVITNGTASFKLYNNDISGQPHGIEIAGNNSVLDSNWIHNLSYTASDPHLDGIFLLSGSNVVLTHNYVDVTVNGEHATAALFVQDHFRSARRTLLARS